MKEVFEKSTTQHFYIEMYSDLAVKLNEFFNEAYKDKIDFRRILVMRCEGLFLCVCICMYSILSIPLV